MSVDLGPLPIRTLRCPILHRQPGKSVNWPVQNPLFLLTHRSLPVESTSVAYVDAFATHQAHADGGFMASTTDDRAELLWHDVTADLLVSGTDPPRC